MSIGSLFIFTIGLGMLFVYSDNRVPRPPAKITPFISLIFQMVYEILDILKFLQLILCLFHTEKY